MKRLDPSRLGGIKVLLPVGIVLWLLIFILGIWPQLRRNDANDLRIAELDSRIAMLGGWQHGRSGLVGGVGLWELELNEAFEHRFPAEPKLKELFHDITAIASRSGIDPIHIRKQETWRDPNSRPGAARRAGIEETVNSLDLQTLCAELGIREDELPRSELVAHRLSVDFNSDYESASRFIAGLARLPRAVNVAAVNLRPGDPGSDAQIELEYYVQAEK